MEEGQEGTRGTAKSPVKIDVEIVEKHLCRGKSPCKVNVRISNISGAPILLNKRLKVGYRDSFDRELFVEVFNKGTNEIVSDHAAFYQRGPAMPQDYEYLEPNRAIVGSFDLCEWYYFPLTLEGGFEMVVYYQADEPNPRGLPEGILRGIHASDRILFKILK